MKKSITLLLMSLFLFNVVGYYGVYLGLRYQSGQELKAKLDAEAYPEDELLTVKLPYALPYQMESKGFERIDGGFENDGVFYKLVKHKVERDTLFIFYMKDHRETNLFKILADFVQSNTDGPASKTALKFMASIVKDYIPTSNSLQVAALGWCQAGTYGDVLPTVVAVDYAVFSPPPDLL